MPSLIMDDAKRPDTGGQFARIRMRNWANMPGMNKYTDVCG